VKIARRCARLAKHALGLPVTLVTDSAVTPDLDFDKVIYAENAGTNHRLSQTGVWRNTDRYSAYHLSPYDETLLMDVDYLVMDDTLLKYFEVPGDYRLVHFNRTATQDWNDTMGQYGLPYVWATVVFFRKTEKSKLLFDMVARIQRNWEYYVALYHMRTDNFRNDYAFAIANSIVSGYTLDQCQSMAGSMLTADKVIGLEKLGSSLVVRDRDRATVTPLMNVHVMDKEYLQSDEFGVFVDGVVNEN
jgi:hypothetical protein